MNEYILQFQQLDLKLRKIEQELGATEERRRSKQLHQYLKESEEKLKQLEEHAEQLSLRLDKLKDSYAENKELIAEYAAAVDKSIDLDELNYLNKKIQRFEQDGFAFRQRHGDAFEGHGGYLRTVRGIQTKASQSQKAVQRGKKQLRRGEKEQGAGNNRNKKKDGSGREKNFAGAARKVPQAQKSGGLSAFCEPVGRKSVRRLSRRYAHVFGVKAFRQGLHRMRKLPQNYLQIGVTAA